MSAVDCHLDKAENGRVERLIQIGDRLAHTVSSHGVLDQVVCTDGEEVCVLGELVSQNSCSRDFDHASDFNVVTDLDAFSDQFSAGCFVASLGILEFLNSGDHREHDAEFAVCGSSEQGSELSAEDVLSHEAETDSSDAQERVHFFFEFIVLQLLVAADVECTDDDRLALHCLEDCLVSFILCLFIGPVFTLHVEEFCTEQTNAFAAVFDNAFSILRGTDVADEQDFVAVCGNGFLVLESLESFFLSLEFFCLLCVFSNLLSCRIQDDFAADGVEDDFVAFVCSIENSCNADDCRNFKGTCHDGAVACAAADFGSEAFCEFLVQGTCVGRCEVLGNDDNRCVDGSQVRDNLTAEVALQTECDVLNVSRSFSHVGIFHGFEDCNHHVGNLFSCVFSVDTVILDHVFDLGTEFRVVGHHQMCVEYCEFFSSQRLGSDFLDLFNVSDCLDESSIKLGELFFRIGILHYDVKNRLFEFVDFCNSNTL